jgi:hypothetical protein
MMVNTKISIVKHNLCRVKVLFLLVYEPDFIFNTQKLYFLCVCVGGCGGTVGNFYSCIVRNGFYSGIVKGKEIPLQALTGPGGSRRLRLPDFKTIGT